MIENLVKQAVEMKIEEYVDREIGEVKKRLEDKIPEIVSSVAIAVFRRLEMERLNDVLTIRVLDERGKR